MCNVRTEGKESRPGFGINLTKEKKKKNDHNLTRGKSTSGRAFLKCRVSVDTLAQKNLHIAPLETTDANEGGRTRGLSGICFNSTVFTLLMGENEAF